MSESRTVIDIESRSGVEVIDVTEAVADLIPPDHERGICHVFVPHTTAAVSVNEHEPGLGSDVQLLLRRLVPPDEEYAHDEIDDNAAAHLRSMLLGASVTIPISAGALALGTWQSVLFIECDGPRTRRLQVTTVTS